MKTFFKGRRCLASAGLSILVSLGVLVSVPLAHAENGWQNEFLAVYPQAGPTLTAAANNCSLCHTSVPQRNAYGLSIQPANDGNIRDRLVAVESVNSDGDTDGAGTACDNITEINADTLPGDPDSTPATCGVVVNQPPVANDDTDNTTLHDVALTIDVLANDTDDGQPVPPGAISINTFDTVSLNGGTVTCAADCTYTPPAGFTGSDSFTYDVTDGDLTSNTATVTITVTNIAPVANDDVASTEEDVPVTINVLANDIDADGDAIVINSFDATSANGGTVDCTTDCQYNPPGGFTGVDTFTYDITDGIATSNRAIVTITVMAGPDNEPPVVTNPGPQTNSENDAVSLPIEATDNVAIASYSASGLPTGLAIDSGTGVISGTVSFDAVVHPDTSGLFATTVTVTDTAGNTSSVTFDWTVNDVNRAPVANDNTASTEADTLVNIDVLANDTDDDGDTLTISAFDATSVSGGTVSCAATCDYTPAAGFTGNDSFTYTAEDGFGGSDVATVSVTVTAGPDLEPPVVDNPGPQTNSENDAVSLQIVATDNVGVTSYLANGLPPGLAIDAAGLISGTVSFDAVVHPALSDTYAVTVTVADAAGNTATVGFDWLVNDVNRDPVAADDAASTPADTAVTVDVLANDSDADGDALVIDAFDATSVNGGTVSCAATCDYTPATGFSGDDTFTYTIIDGFGGSATATVTISVAPAAVVDLDIAQFKVTKRVRLANVKPIGIQLTVRNAGTVNGTETRVATVIGVQLQDGGAVEVYRETMDVSDPVGNGRTKFDFPSFEPDAAGDINWTASIADDDPDDDVATATTTVVPVN